MAAAVFPLFPAAEAYVICRSGDGKRKGATQKKKDETRFEKQRKKLEESTRIYFLIGLRILHKAESGACLGDEFEKEREVTERTRAFRCTHRVGPSP